MLGAMATLSAIEVIFIFRERGSEGEKHQCVVASGVPTY